MMKPVIEANELTKKFGQVTALDGIDLKVSGPSIIGLLGKNGSGKTTFIRQLMGLYLPSEGSIKTFGKSSEELDHDDLAHIGYVPQEICLLDWMTVGQHLQYVSSFYPQWDDQRQQKLLKELELDADSLVGTLSQGNLQKLAIILAVCHHPGLLVLDEPVSDLDPIVRRKLLEFLLELMSEDEATILVSSHVLRDVEKIVDWVVCLDRGRLVTDAALDTLQELYAEWLVTSLNASLPGQFPESFILGQRAGGREARVLVKDARGELDDFCDRYDADVTVRSLNLEEIFPILIGEKMS